MCTNENGKTQEDAAGSPFCVNSAFAISYLLLLAGPCGGAEIMSLWPNTTCFSCTESHQCTHCTFCRVHKTLLLATPVRRYPIACCLCFQLSCSSHITYHKQEAVASTMQCGLHCCITLFYRSTIPNIMVTSSCNILSVEEL
jgi:hypothetical protein